MDKHGIDALVAIGGEGTLTVARMFHDDGINVVGVPKTIDNDLSATDRTFGFDTAVSIATESIDRLRTTGEAHSRCMVVEVMGRNVGWIALHAGIAAGAHAILIPEVPVTEDQVCAWAQHAMDRGRAPTIVVAEGFSFASFFTTTFSADSSTFKRFAGEGASRLRCGGSSGPMKGCSTCSPRSSSCASALGSSLSFRFIPEESVMRAGDGAPVE